jgi:hypothetical protein
MPCLAALLLWTPKRYVRSPEAYVMDEVASTRRSPKPIFTFAAWFSLLVPLLAAGWAHYAASAGPDPNAMQHGTVLDSKAVLVVLALVFAAGFAAGCVSLWGVRANGALVILPPALLGILVSAALEVLALFFLLLTGLPGP